MFWVVVDRVTTLTFLLLAVLLIVQVTSDKIDNSKMDALSSEMRADRKEIKGVIENNLRYFEGRINKLAQTQDEYQVSTAQKIFLLENRLKILEQENRALKNQQKIITNNINTNNNIINSKRPKL